MIRIYTVLDTITVTVASTLTTQVVGENVNLPVLYSVSERFSGDDCVEEITDRVRQALAAADGYAGDLVDHVSA